jgi:peptidoglycan/LPS O-acetylase OafA/YrhL
MNRNLAAVRGLLCSQVVLGHLLLMANFFPKSDLENHAGNIFLHQEPLLLLGIRIISGDLPVTLFFMISGFLLYNSIHRQNDSTNTSINFLRVRFFRLFPTFIISVVAVTLLTIFSNYFNLVPGVNGSDYANIWWPQDLTFSGFLRDLTLIQVTLNPPLWSLRIEIIFIFFLAIFSRFQRFFTVDIFILFTLLSALLVFFPVSAHSWVVGFFAYLYVFLTGCVISKYDSELQRVGLVPITTLFILLIVGYVTLIALDIHGVLRSLISLGIGIFLLLLVKLITLKEGFFFGILMQLGKVSYEIYCLHFPIILFVLSLLSKLDMKIQEIGIGQLVPYIYTLTCIFATYFLSLLINRLGLNMRKIFLTNSGQSLH